MEFYRRVDFYISVAALFLVIVLVIYQFYQNYVFIQEFNDLSSKFQNHVRQTEAITTTFTNPRGFIEQLSGQLTDLYVFSEDLNNTVRDNFDLFNNYLETNNTPKLTFLEAVEPWHDNRNRRRSRTNNNNKKQAAPASRSRWGDNDGSGDEPEDSQSYINDQVSRGRRTRGVRA
jgi:hypothetical protein